jgi:hypothetical protein
VLATRLKNRSPRSWARSHRLAGRASAFGAAPIRVAAKVVVAALVITNATLIFHLVAEDKAHSPACSRERCQAAAGALHRLRSARCRRLLAARS